MVLGFLAVDNFDFTRKIVKKIWVKTLGCVKIEFLDKTLTFQIVWLARRMRHFEVIFKYCANEIKDSRFVSSSHRPKVANP